MGTYYKNVPDHLDGIDNGDFLEIGVDRGEGSTRFFADIAKERGVKFVGVDASPEQIEFAGDRCKHEDGSMLEHVELVSAKGEDYLSQLRDSGSDRKFSMVYLDNFDWDYWLDVPPEPFVAGAKQYYRDTMGIEMTNLNSQLTHMIQAVRLLPFLTPNCLVVCDDTWFEPKEGIFIGKCSAVLPYLIVNGFKLVHNGGYRNRSGGCGAIMVRSN